MSGKVVVVTNKRVAPPRKVGRRRRKRQKVNSNEQILNSGGMALTAEYIKSLCDPWEHQGPYLGWGCLVPSSKVTGYYRGSTVAAASDGSCTFAAMPCVSDTILVWGNTIGVPGVTNTISCVNATQIAGNATEGRVISFGLRAWPLVASTSVPGQVYFGSMTPYNYQNINTMSTSDFISLPTTSTGIGNLGASCTGRPIDPDSFIFTSFVVGSTGYDGAITTDIPFSVPYISFSGLPANTVVGFEVVINIETLTKIGHLGVGILSGQDVKTRSALSDYWPSFEGMYKTIANILPSPGRAMQFAASLDGERVSNLLSTASRINKGGLRAGSLNLLHPGSLSRLGRGLAAPLQGLLT